MIFPQAMNQAARQTGSLFLFALSQTVLNSLSGNAEELNWIAGPQTQLERREDSLLLTSTGDDPQIQVAGLQEFQEAAFLRFEMKSRGKAPARVYWTTAEPAQFSEKQSKQVETVHNDAWHAYEVVLDGKSSLRGLRIDPFSGQGRAEIAGLALVDASGRAVYQWLPARPSVPSGDAVIRAPLGESEIVVKTTSRLAGAIDSLSWNGQEFIDSFDHGRQLQSACSFGDGGPFHAECFNPTEAGSRMDGRGPLTTSRLLNLVKSNAALQTTTQLAFWLAPWEKSEGKPALNRESLSDHLISKTVQLNADGREGVIRYDVTFRVPVGEKHSFAQFEALTGYMPAEFEAFFTFDPATGERSELDDGPGEQKRPVIFATRSGSHAMGIWSRTPAGRKYTGPTYGRFRFKTEKVVKWNSVYRLTDATGVPAGDHSFEQFVFVGALRKVQTAMKEVIAAEQ